MLNMWFSSMQKIDASFEFKRIENIIWELESGIGWWIFQLVGILVSVESCSYIIANSIMSKGGNILVVPPHKLDKSWEENAACKPRANESIWFREF